MVRPNQMPTAAKAAAIRAAVNLERVLDDEKAVFDESHRDDQDPAADAVDREVFHWER